MARAALVVDSRAAALQESGDVVQSIGEGRFGEEHIRAELGEVAAGCKVGRRSAGGGDAVQVAGAGGGGCRGGGAGVPAGRWAGLGSRGAEISLDPDVRSGPRMNL